MQPQKSISQQELLPKPPIINNHHRHKRGSFLATLFVLLLIGASAFVFFYRQTIVDKITVWRFVPTASLVTLANTSGLNDLGKYYLYASQAEISNQAEFNSACGSLQNERTVVLGCYVGQDRRIYIYDVTDSSLDGVRETTTAHEMLHAAYDRLSPWDKKHVDDLLVAEKSKITDARILDLIKDYELSEPDEVVNELHSIFGTEVRTLSPELETYYKRYFTDRSEVVALKEKYEKVFTDLATKQTSLVAELNRLASDVNTKQEEYGLSLETLNSDIAAFNEWSRSGTAKKSEYESRRAVLEDRIATLDSERDMINGEIDTYNVKKAELDKLNLQAATLNQSIDSKLSPAPSL